MLTAVGPVFPGGDRAVEADGLDTEWERTWRVQVGISADTQTHCWQKRAVLVNPEGFGIGGCCFYTV